MQPYLPRQLQTKPVFSDPESFRSQKSDSPYESLKQEELAELWGSQLINCAEFYAKGDIQAALIFLANLGAQIKEWLQGRNSQENSLTDIFFSYAKSRMGKENFLKFKEFYHTYFAYCINMSPGKERTALSEALREFVSRMEVNLHYTIVTQGMGNEFSIVVQYKGESFKLLDRQCPITLTYPEKPEEIALLLVGATIKDATGQEFKIARICKKYEFQSGAHQDIDPETQQPVITAFTKDNNFIIVSDLANVLKNNPLQVQEEPSSTADRQPVQAPQEAAPVDRQPAPVPQPTAEVDRQPAPAAREPAAASYNPGFHYGNWSVADSQRDREFFDRFMHQ